MDSLRVTTNGERENPATMEENPATTASRRSPSQSQTPQLQAESHGIDSILDEELFRFQSRVDLQTLESSFGMLSVLDSSVPPQNPPRDNRWSNRSSSSSLHNQPINGGGGGIGSGGGFWSRPPPNTPLPEIDPQQLMMNDHYYHRLSFQNDCVNRGSYYDYANSGQSGSSGNVMLNNGFLNGNSRDVSYFSRNRLMDQSPWGSNNGFGSGINDCWSRNGGSSRASIVSLAKQRDSSNVLQKKISEGTQETIDVIFNEVIYQICELMVDPFGNHVAQKLMERCSSEQITQILYLVTQHQYRFANICLDPIGIKAEKCCSVWCNFRLVFVLEMFRTRAMQSLMKCLASEDQILRIVEAISMVALTFTTSNNGKHVVLQCFNQFSPLQNQNLLEVIAQNCYPIAIDQHGCCMLQQCLAIDCQVLKKRLIHEIILNALRLCVNCYGNYVVQYIVELEDENVTLELVQQLIGNYAYLSRNKYGSHAVQKLLKIQYIDTSVIIYDLIRDIDTLLLDPFGNYVIQTAWFVCKDYTMRYSLMWHINRNKRLMRCNKFGNKILEKLNL
ncbi:unnamed protein product [Thlaspi arvense]|uniref:PUM-HD domain-containing protein n=1 Tax=Thlaspi arvense TaxID=13288 RepID=A0AAU9RP15_THLAR|nr:unnamed protein product [Thlaspi arvense]